MKKIFFFISMCLIVACSGSIGSVEGIITDLKKADNIGDFIYIEIESRNGKKEKLYSNGKSFSHYTYDHLVSHQLSNDKLKIDYSVDSGKKIIESIHEHNHSH